MLKQFLRLEYYALKQDRNSWLTQWLFFVLIVLMFPLAISPESSLLKTISPGIIWISALLASLLSSEQLFAKEIHDDSIFQYFLSPYNLYWIILTKIIIRWLFDSLPLIFSAYFLAIFFHYSPAATAILCLSLAIGSLNLNLLAGIGSALLGSIKKNNFLLAILIFPLFIPNIIFGTLATQAALNNLSASGMLSFLISLMFLLMIIAPYLILHALKISLQLK